MTIGPKCQLCGKSAKYHSAVYKLCPMGKRRRCPITLRIMYEDSHPTNKFTPREPRKRGGSEKRKDRSVRRYVKLKPCAACGHPGSRINPIDPCHLRTWKVTQCDLEIAMIPLCRFHHQQSHLSGWGKFFDLYPHVLALVKSQGWDVTPDPFQHGRVILSHPEVA